MDKDKIYEEPSDVTAVDGIVDVDGPDGVEVQLTPDAALETSDRLLAKAAEARGQTVREAMQRRELDLGTKPRN